MEGVKEDDDERVPVVRNMEACSSNLQTIVMDEVEERKTGRGNDGLVRRGDKRCQANETGGKGKGKGNGGKRRTRKGSHGSKGTQEAPQNTRMMKGADKDEEEEQKHEEDEGLQMAPNTTAGGSYTRAIRAREKD